MHIIFTEEEKEWIDKVPFNWTIKNGCPNKIKNNLEKKLNLLKKETYNQKEVKK